MTAVRPDHYDYDDEYCADEDDDDVTRQPEVSRVSSGGLDVMTTSGSASCSSGDETTFYNVAVNIVNNLATFTRTGHNNILQCCFNVSLRIVYAVH